jgi:hypothetical protein
MGKAHADKPAIRFLLNKSKAIATNTYLMLYPKVALQRLIESDHQVIEQIFDLLKDASWNAMHEFARTHAGGLSKIEPRELQEVWLGPVADNIRAAATIQLFS